MNVWVLLIAAMVSAPAVRAETSAEPKPVIWSSGYYDSVKASFSPDDYSYMDRDEEARAMHADGFLRPDERDALFRNLGLDTRLGGMDELDKDMLVQDARAYSVAELTKQYPTLTRRQLARLKVAVEKIK